MQNVYEHCPKFENERYLIRFLEENDCSDLLKVYSDEKSRCLFNRDNCRKSNSPMTETRMKEIIDSWHLEYRNRVYVRWTIVDKKTHEAIGTIELFNRQARDYFTNCGLLRLDLRSDYEKETEIKEILSLILMPSFSLFSCDKIATKAIPEAKERIRALESLGFSASSEKLIGHDGTIYGNYFVLNL